MTKERTADVIKNTREGRQGRKKRQGYKKTDGEKNNWEKYRWTDKRHVYK